MTTPGRLADGAGWAAVVAVVACCGIVALLATGVAAAVLWAAGLGLAGAAVVVLGGLLFLKRHRGGACEECRRLGTRAMHRLEHEGGRR